MSKTKNQTDPKRLYAAERIKAIAEDAAADVEENPIHTNEVFALIRKHKIAPVSAREFWAHVRSMAKDRRAFDVTRVASPIRGDTIGYIHEVERLENTREEAARNKRLAIRDMGANLADKVVILETLTPQEGIAKMRAFIKAQK